MMKVPAWSCLFVLRIMVGCDLGLYVVHLSLGQQRHEPAPFVVYRGRSCCFARYLYRGPRAPFIDPRTRPTILWTRQFDVVLNLFHAFGEATWECGTKQLERRLRGAVCKGNEHRVRVVVVLRLCWQSAVIEAHTPHGNCQEH